LHHTWPFAFEFEVAEQVEQHGSRACVGQKFFNRSTELGALARTQEEFFDRQNKRQPCENL
jgi:hypothetical protein